MTQLILYFPQLGKKAPYDPQIVDSFLWNQLKAGDKDSYEVFFKSYYLKLCAFSNQFTKNMDDAREVVQELLIYLWENKEKVKEIKSVKAYVYSALRFNSIRKYRYKTTEILQIEDVPEKELLVDFQNELELAELQKMLIDTIDLLPAQCAKIFKMSRFEKMTHKEISNALSISTKTVESQIRKALQLFQKSLDNYLSAIIFFFLI